jgi:ABC-type antimicrobial peptide transport system permease subunit
VIVGVVNHVKYAGLTDSGPENQYQAYYPLAQVPDQWVSLNYSDANVVIRTPLDTASLFPAITASVYQAGSDQPIYDVQTMHQIIAKSMSEQRFPMILLAGFAGLALLLASVGVYGMISQSVAVRVQEIGIRMALGADKREILRLFLGQEFKLVLTGIAIGTVGAVMLTRVLVSFSHLLYGVSPIDPLTFAAVSIGIIVLATFVAYIPARRASNVDPMVVLRNE